MTEVYTDTAARNNDVCFNNVVVPAACLIARMAGREEVLLCKHDRVVLKAY
jgi:hypothetical protein